MVAERKLAGERREEKFKGEEKGVYFSVIIGNNH